MERVGRELAVSESVQAPGTPSVWVAEEELSALEGRGGWGRLEQRCSILKDCSQLAGRTLRFCGGNM